MKVWGRLRGWGQAQPQHLGGHMGMEGAPQHLGVSGGGGGCSVVPTVTLPPGRGKWEGDSEKGKGKEK